VAKAYTGGRKDKSREQRVVDGLFVAKGTKGSEKNTTARDRRISIPQPHLRGKRERGERRRLSCISRKSRLPREAKITPGRHASRGGLSRMREGQRGASRKTARIEEWTGVTQKVEKEAKRN